MSHLIKIYAVFANTAIFVSGTKRVNGCNRCATIKHWVLCDGPGKTSSAGASYNLDYSRARAYCACSRCGGGGVVWTFFLLSIISLFLLPLSGRRPDID